jgi:hypothetical protein
VAAKNQSLATLPAGRQENRVMRQFGWLNVHFASSVCPTVMQCDCRKFSSSNLMTTSRQLCAAPIMQAAAAISIMISLSFFLFSGFYFRIRHWDGRGEFEMLRFDNTPGRPRLPL